MALRVALFLTHQRLHPQGPHRLSPASPAYPTDVVFLNFTSSDLLSAFAYAYYPIRLPIVAASTLVADQEAVFQQCDDNAVTIAVPSERPVDEVSTQRPTLLLTWILASIAVDDSATVGELEATIEELDLASSDDDLVLATPKFIEDCSTSTVAQVAEVAVAVECDEIMVYGAFTSFSVFPSSLPTIKVLARMSIPLRFRAPTSSATLLSTSLPPTHTHTTPSSALSRLSSSHSAFKRSPSSATITRSSRSPFPTHDLPIL